MTNVKSLLALYVKMGGSLTDTYADIAGGVPVGQYSTISDAILACSKKYSSGGGGGAEKFVVALTQESDTWTADKTIAEIVAADAAGKIVVAKFVFDGTPIEIPLVSASSDGTMIVAIFSGLGAIELGFQFIGVYDESDAWEYTETTIPKIPDYSSSNNGQVLGVSSDSLAWVDSNAPLIVTLTAGQEAGQFVGDKTYKEAYDAFIAGCNVVFYSSAVGLAETVTAAQNDTSAADPYAISTKSFTSSGVANDYISVTVGG